MKLFNTKSWLLLVCLLIFCLVSLTGGMSLVKAQEPLLRVMVWSWSPEIDKALEKALAEYQELRATKIDLLQVKPDAYWDSLLEWMESPSPPDVLWMHSDMVAPLFEKGQVIQLERFFTRKPEVALDIPSELLDRFRYKGELCGIPLGTEEPFALNAYAISFMAKELGKDKLAFDLITFLRTRIPPPPPTAPPPPPEAARPDLVLADLWDTIEEGRWLVITAQVANAGDARATETILRAESGVADWWAAETTVPGLDSDNVIEVILELEIPDDLRGRSHFFRVCADPWNDITEWSDDNNCQEIEVWVPESGEEPVGPGDDATLPTVAVVGVIAIAAIATFSIRHSIKFHRHKEWQEKAEEEEPQETCEPCTRYCRKIELEVEPALRKIAHLSLSTYDTVSSEQSKERQVKGEIVDGLNKAVRANRRREKPEKLQRQVAPLAQALLQQIMEWLRSEPAPRDVSIAGHLEGGKVTFQFILYHCKRIGNVNVWEKEDKWKATVEDKRDEPVGILRSLNPAEPSISEGLASELTQLLVRLIEKV